MPPGSRTPMQNLGRRAILIALVAAVGLAGAWFALFGASWGAVSSIESNSMSHAEEDMDDVLDPGEWRRLEDVSQRGQVVSFYEARDSGHRVGEDFGDVIAFRPVGVEDGSSGVPIFPGMGGDDVLRIEHRAIAWVVYNETADAYDVPELDILAQRAIQLPDVGRWDPRQEAYVHEMLTVRLDPDKAGRHDGFLTKGDFNPSADQDADTRLRETGSVALVSVDRVDGRVAAHVDSDTILALQIGIPIASLGLAGMVYAWRRGHLDRFLPSGETHDQCPSCGAEWMGGQAFCHSCGHERVDG